MHVPYSPDFYLEQQHENQILLQQNKASNGVIGELKDKENSLSVI